LTRWLCGGHLRHAYQRTLRLLIVVPQLHQQLAFLDAVALFHRQHFDAAAHDGRQLGALAGFNAPGAGCWQSSTRPAHARFP
jgi:hypothetical protein